MDAIQVSGCLPRPRKTEPEKAPTRCQGGAPLDSFPGVSTRPACHVRGLSIVG